MAGCSRRPTRGPGGWWRRPASRAERGQKGRARTSSACQPGRGDVKTDREGRWRTRRVHHGEPRRGTEKKAEVEKLEGSGSEATGTRSRGPKVDAMSPKEHKSLARSLGEFFGHIWKGVKADPGAG